MTANILIRNVPPDTLRRIQAEAARLDRSQNDIVLAALTARYGEPPAVVGYIKLHRNGDLPLARPEEDEPATCAECGRDLDWPWVAILMDGSLHMPLCSACATSE